MAPTMKKTSETIITGFRPKMWEKEAKFGWKIVEQRRKDVPDQKASIAVPLSLSAIIWPGQILDIVYGSSVPVFQILTGRATDSDVPSRATIKVMTASVRNAR